MGSAVGGGAATVGLGVGADVGAVVGTDVGAGVGSVGLKAFNLNTPNVSFTNRSTIQFIVIVNICLVSVLSAFVTVTVTLLTPMSVTPSPITISTPGPAIIVSMNTLSIDSVVMVICAG